MLIPLMYGTKQVGLLLGLRNLVNPNHRIEPLEAFILGGVHILRRQKFWCFLTLTSLSVDNERITTKMNQDNSYAKAKTLF